MASNFSDRDVYNYINAILRAADSGIRKAGKQLQKDARARAPRLTGELRRRIELRPSPLNKVSYGVSGEAHAEVGVWDLVYARPQEQGYRIYTGKPGDWMTRTGKYRVGERIYFKRYTTPGTGAHYLYGVFDANRSQYEQIIVEEIRAKMAGKGLVRGNG